MQGEKARSCRCGDGIDDDLDDGILAVFLDVGFQGFLVGCIKVKAQQEVIFQILFRFFVGFGHVVKVGFEFIPQNVDFRERESCVGCFFAQLGEDVGQLLVVPFTRDLVQGDVEFLFLDVVQIDDGNGDFGFALCFKDGQTLVAGNNGICAAVPNDRLHQNRLADILDYTPPEPQPDNEQEEEPPADATFSMIFSIPEQYKGAVDAYLEQDTARANLSAAIMESIKGED